MQKIHGRNVTLFHNGMAVACSNSCEIVSDCEMLETSSPLVGRARTYISGKTGWQVSIGKFVPVDGFADMILMAGDNMDIIIGEIGEGRHLGNDAVRGNVLVQQTRGTFTLSQLSQGSIQLLGNGPLLDARLDKSIKIVEVVNTPISLKPEFFSTGWRIGVVDNIPSKLFLTSKNITTSIYITTERPPSPDTAYIYNGDAYIWKDDRFVHAEMFYL